MKKSLNIMSLNIGNPSIDRARLQTRWLEERDEDVFVLTETKNSEGCNYIADYFLQYGFNLLTLNNKKKYYVHFPKSQTADLGVMIISKFPIKNNYSIFNQDNIYFSRFVACDIEFYGTDIHLIGLYVPSRDRSDKKIARKKDFCIDTAKYIKQIKDKEHCVICGDLNILDRHHIPHYSTFFEWEYAFYDFFAKNDFVDTFKFCNPNSNEHSWVGRTNDGYRYDYCFINKKNEDNIINSFYFHETRGKFTDHSAIVLEIYI